MTKIWQTKLHFSQKTMTKTKSKFAVKNNTAETILLLGACFALHLSRLSELECPIFKNH